MKIYLLIISCLLFSCSNIEEKRSPEILSEIAFETILKEVHLAESSFEINKNKNLKNARVELSNSYFNIYNNNQTSEEEFKETLNYYSKNPEKLKQIYANVLQQLTNERTKIDQQ